jgi:hypothetical protein
MKNCIHSRRKFLKISAGGAAGMLINGMSAENAAAKTLQDPLTIWEDGMQINPAIDNLRVVCCHDPSMVQNNPLSWTIEGQNDPVISEKVYENMDKMAIALAGLEIEDPEDIAANAAAAWATIFQKPEDKEWADVNVAIKINTVPRNWARLAVISKVTMALHELGVPYGNIYVYDAGDINFRGSNYIPEYQSSYSRARLPQGLQVTDYVGGDTLPATLPNGMNVDCVTGLANGMIDILINIALNKHHWIERIGFFTGTVKNHLGSLRFGHEDTLEGNIDLFEAITKSRPILGDGLPCRQQLSIIDSLWAHANDGPDEMPDTAVHRIIMGTFSPIVDYLTVRKIRENTEIMDVQEHALPEMIDSFVTRYGYDLESPEIVNLDFVDALSYEPTVSLKRKTGIKASSSGAGLGFHGAPGKKVLVNANTGFYDLKGRRIPSSSIPGN